MSQPSKPFTVKDSTTKPLFKFASGAEAWFWFMRTDKARAEGVSAARTNALMERPCDPDDIYSCVSRLYQEGRLYPIHLEVLGEYGYLDRHPYLDDEDEIIDCYFWHTAFQVLEPYLIEKEIVECQPRKG